MTHNTSRAQTIQALVLVGILICLPISLLAQPSGQQRPTPVIVSTIQSTLFIDEVEALGTLRANESVDLTSTVTERVTRVNFSDGERVKKGDVLVTMDATEERAELTEEQSRLSVAKRQIERLKPLAAKNAATESALDIQQQEVETAKARIQAIQSRIERRTIVAPFDGVVGLRNISVGALSQPGSVITSIDDDSIMKLDFSVPARYLASLKPGVGIDATVRSYPNEIFSGAIDSINSRVDPVTRSVVVRAIIENPQQRLKPGLLMRVVLKTNPRQALVVPEEALTTIGKENFVFVVNESNGEKTVERRVVELGTRRAGEAEIIAGLKAEEQVVIHGNLRIRSGSVVTVTAEENGDQTLKELLYPDQQRKET